MLQYIVVNLLPIASWILLASLKSVGVIVVVLGTQKLCARWLSPQFKFALWFALLAGVVVPFGPELHLPLQLGAEAQSNSILSPNSNGTTTIGHDAPKLSWGADLAEPIAVSSSALLLATLLFVWMGVALLLITHVARNVSRCRRLIAAASEVEGPPLALFEQCKAAMQVSKPVRVLESAAVDTPAVFGWRAPIVLLPRDLATQVRSVELRHVFLHELAHVRRKDILVNWLLTAVQIVHWFNPFMWYALSAARNDMEKACDADALESLSASERPDYGRTLIKLADFAPRRTFLAHGVSIVQTHSLKSRIAMIAQFKPTKTLYSAFGIVLLSMLSAMAVTQPRSNETTAATSNGPIAEATSAVKTESLARGAKLIEPAVESQRGQSVALRLAAADPKRNDGLQTEYIKLSYMRAQDLVSLIRPGSGIGLLSRDGSAAVDPRTNIVLVRDTADKLKQIHEMIKALDVPLGQVIIEAHIAIVSDDFIRDMRAKKIGTSASVAPLNSEFPFAAELAAAEANGKAEVISSPRLITGDRKEAAIEQGIEFTAKDSGKQNTVTLRIAMTPQISENDAVLMNVNVVTRSKDSVGDQSTKEDATNSKQAVDQRKVGTQILIKDGQTFVLGDIVEGKKTNLFTPFDSFGDDKHLLVFLTTRIARQDVARLD